MRCPTDRATRGAVTLLLVVFLVYLSSYGTYRPPPHTEASTSSLAGEEIHLQPQRNISHRAQIVTPRSPHFTVINNKVYDIDAVPSKVFKAPKNDRPVLELSEAAALQRIDFSQFSSEERQYLEGRVAVMTERARQVKRACLNAPVAVAGRIPHLVWDRNHHVVWCPNYKVASTTWMINFLKLAHFNDDNAAIPSNLPPEKREELKYSPKYGAKHYEVFNQYPKPTTLQDKMAALEDSARVIIVRHPFTRILSAYRDKMIKLKPLPAKFKFREIQKKIIKKYRPADSTETSPFPTFPEFVQYVIDFTASFTTAQEWHKNVKCWTPFWSQCDVCNMDYNVIMKLETMPEDERFLITLSDMKELKKTEGEWRHLRNVSSTQAAPDYYQKLTTRQMIDLHQRYKFDFELFGYTLDAYLPLANDYSDPSRA